MRRCLCILTLLVALGAASTSAVAQAPGAKLALGAKLQDCHSGTTPEQRYAVFIGQMPVIAGTKRMAMRFDLFQHITAEGFQHIAVPKFGVWQKSLANQTGFVFTRRVDALAAPANYRVVVSFRWYDSHGKVQRTVARTTATCTQPDPRPNLSVGRVQGARGPVKGTVDYDIVVRNQGLGDAGPFGVLLTVNGQVQPQQTVVGLAAGAKTDVSVTAPTCTPGSTVTIQLDPQNQVIESNEGDDSFTRPCP